METGKGLVAGFGIAMIAAVLFWACIFWRYDIKDNILPLDETEILKTELQTGEDAETAAAVLPDDPQKERAVLFKTTHTRVEVLADGESIYRYGWEEDAPAFMRSPGPVWHLVSLPPDSGGKTLTVRIYSVYKDYFGNDPVLIYGSRGGCVLKLLKSILFIVIINCIIIFVGVFSLLFHFTIGDGGKSQRKTMGRFLFLGFFALLIAVWSLCQSGFLQFLIPDGRTLYYVDFFSFFLFPVPFNLFVTTICRTDYGKGFKFFSWVYLINMAADVVLQLTSAVDIFMLLPVTHMIMMANAVYVFWAVHREIRIADNTGMRKFRAPLYIIMMFALAELTVYYAREFRETSVFLPLGTFTFIVLLVWMQVREYYQNRLEEQKLDYFKKLAGTDMLTGARNRNAYEKAINELEERRPEEIFASVITFDINNMKMINDNFGHDKGDEALKCCYECICRVYGDEGQCFRIGGDEFAYFGEWQSGKVLEDLAKQFEQAVEEKNRELPFPFYVAAGYAVFDAHDDRGINDTLRRSDSMMYQNKEMLKRKHGGGSHGGGHAMEEKKNSAGI